MLLSQADSALAGQHIQGLGHGTAGRSSIGDGIGGTFSVYVVLDDDGAIESVTIGTNFESDQVGKLAFEQLKPLYVGLSTAEEINAIDAVGGATVSSEALRSAVKQAMGL